MELTTENIRNACLDISHQKDIHENKAINIKVNTPKGKKYHCKIISFNNKQEYYIYREVKNKDKMQINNAWTIHPDVIKKYLEATYIIFYNKDNDFFYKISMNDALEFGTNMDYYSGGETFYIPINKFKAIKNEIKT